MAAGPARWHPAGFTGCSFHSLLQAAIKTIRSAFERVQASALLHSPLQFALPRSQAGKLSGARRREPLRHRESGLAGGQGTSSGNPGQGDPLPVPSVGMSDLTPAHSGIKMPENCCSYTPHYGRGSVDSAGQVHYQSPGSAHRRHAPGALVLTDAADQVAAVRGEAAGDRLKAARLERHVAQPRFVRHGPGEPARGPGG